MKMTLLKLFKEKLHHEVSSGGSLLVDAVSFAFSSENLMAVSLTDLRHNDCGI